MRYWKSFVKSLIGKTNKEIIEICQPKLQRLHKVRHWSSRIVFAINDHWVIKIARSECGIEQNKQEILTWDAINDYCEKEKRYFAKVLLDMSDTEDYRFVIMERLNTKKYVRRWYDNVKLQNSVQNVDRVMGNDNYRDLKLSNVGSTKTKGMKCIDYGCSKSVCDSFRLWRNNNDTSEIKFKII